MPTVPALSNGDICNVPTLWDGQTDNKAKLNVTIDNVQQGDIIEVTVTLSGAGCFQWTCVARSGDVTPLASNQGFFAGANPPDMNTFEDRSWTILLQSNAVQSVTIGLDHASTPLVAAAGALNRGGTGITTVVMAGLPGYRVANVTLSACVIGKTY